MFTWARLTEGRYFHTLELINSGVVISKLFLEHGIRLDKPPPHFSLGMANWEECSDKHEMDDLLW